MGRRYAVPVFGEVSNREQREADLFLDELIGARRIRPDRQGEGFVPPEDETVAYRTGELRARPGWTYVAYLQHGLVRLGFHVLRPTPAGRIGNVGWVTNNPGSIDLERPGPNARVCARVAVEHGAFEKNADDISTYRRFAVFPSAKLGAAAILPEMFCLARHNGNPPVGSVLGMYYGIRDAERRAAYVTDIRVRLVRSYARRLRLTDRGLSDSERTRRATDLANGLLARRMLELERFVTYDSQYLEAAVLDVESARDMARVGLRFSCSGFRNAAKVRSIYAREAAKLREIQALVDSAAAATELRTVLECLRRIRETGH
ncbi:MAG: hypothetical protein JW940_35065 [Polyangiaceae bacterium]|nr:hypothetical protein [Polyangiaceae bacterium]